MQSSSISTTNEIFLDSLVKKFDLPKAQKYFSSVDSDFEELFAEVLGRIYKSSVYISKDRVKEDERFLRLEKDRKFNATELLDFGYNKVERVWEEGEFSVLGDVIIIWPYSMSNVLRVSLWGNEIEKIEVVKPDNRRTMSTVQSKDILSKESSKVIGSENYSRSKLLYLVDDIDRSKDIVEIGLRRIPGIYNYTDTHTTTNIIKNYKSIGYEVWYLTKNIERFESGSSDRKRIKQGYCI